MLRRVTAILFMSLSGLLVLGPFLVRAVQRPVPPEPLSRQEMATLLDVAREAALSAATGAEAPADPGAPDEVSTSSRLTSPPPGPVLVTIHGVGLVARRVPPLGVWLPGEQTDGTTLQDAVRMAAARAGRACRMRRMARSRLEAARIKVDVGGASRPVPLAVLSYLRLVVDPGRDGFLARHGDDTAAFPPSWVVERTWWKLDGALRYLRAVLGGPDVDLDLALFRTRAFVEGVPEEPGPLPVFRATVLLPELTSGAVYQSIKTAGEYLARMVGPDGRYCYTYFSGLDRCDSAYNLLRHAGTTYSLYQAYREVGDPAMLEAAERAAGWLRRQVRPVRDDPARVYLIEGKRAKLGAVGLGLLALIEREKAVGDGKDRALLEKMGNFVLGQQREDGFLESWFDWGPGADVPRTNSIYYPGEALLGLVRLHGIDPRQRWLDAAIKSARFLALERWRWAGIELYVPVDAWLTQALAELHEQVQDPVLEDYTYELIEVTDVTQLRADEGAAPDLAGGPAFGFILPGVTPAGSRTEGLTAAYWMAQRAGHRDRAAWIKRLAYEAARFQIHHQFRAANSYFLPNPARALGGFRSRPDKLDVRIDYVQHNLTGLLGVLRMLREDGR